MDKGAPPTLFVNDGSFMERFKQLQQDNGKDLGKDKAQEKDSKPKTVISGSVNPKPVIGKTSFSLKSSNSSRTPQSTSGGKLAFSLKQKSKLVAPPVRLGGDEEDEDDADAGTVTVDVSAKRPKLGQSDSNEQKLRQADVAPPSPSNPMVKDVADKLASFVAKNGRQIEHITRQKNPGDTPFKFLFDKTCTDYKYYEYQIAEEERLLSQTKDSQVSSSGARTTLASKSARSSQRSRQQQPHYETPASALYEAIDEPSGSVVAPHGAAEAESSEPPSLDSLAMMEFYMKKAAHEERRKPPKQSNDEMPPPASLQPSAKRGHHMGDYIPSEELEKFLATCNDVSAQKAAREVAEKAKIQADNVGHKLLSKMGWREGEGLGSSRSGIADPIMAGDVKKDHLGVGAHQPGEVTPEDDIYEQYKKRMMLGYRYRPNPLNNPRKAYY